MQVEWTPELHNIFASVVESIGVDRAVPSQILSGMGAAGIGLTRQNIASHLQKYRNRCICRRATPSVPVQHQRNSTGSLFSCSKAHSLYVAYQTLQFWRCRTRIGSTTGVLAPMPMRTASAPLGSLNQPVAGLPLMTHSSCQLPALLPGTPCWAMGVPQPTHASTGWATWPAAVPALPQALPPPAPSQPSVALLASLQQAMREPTVHWQPLLALASDVYCPCC